MPRGATALRADQRFAISIDFLRTQCLNPKGKVLKDGDGTSAEAFYKALKLNEKSQFFVEGGMRLQLIKQGNTSPLLYEIKPKKIRERALSGDTVLIHKSIPPAVLRPRHLRDSDEYLPLPLARPNAEGFAEGMVAETDVREIATPLTHVRGTVTAIGFDLTVSLKRVAPSAKPTGTFINIAGQPWELQFESAGAAAPNAG